MKVCFFNRSYWPDHGATGQLLTELCEDLSSRHGFEVTVVCGEVPGRARTGWAPRIPLERSLADTLDHWRSVTARAAVPAR